MKLRLLASFTLSFFTPRIHDAKLVNATLCLGRIYVIMGFKMWWVVTLWAEWPIIHPPAHPTPPTSPKNPDRPVKQSTHAHRRLLRPPPKILPAGPSPRRRGAATPPGRAPAESLPASYLVTNSIYLAWADYLFGCLVPLLSNSPVLVPRSSVDGFSPPRLIWSWIRLVRGGRAADPDTQSWWARCWSRHPVVHLLIHPRFE
jgi:hypothetical protein